MDFDLNEEQTMFRNLAREFGQREVIPGNKVADAPTGENYRIDVVKKLGPLGLLGGPVPQEYGGLGMDYISYGLVCEELARASAGFFTTSMTVHVSLFQLTILSWGSEELKKKYLPRTTSGELLGCFAMTEPNVGSDPASMETSAVLKDNHWVINGTKMWISNGSIADLAVVFAQTDKAKRHRGMIALLLDTKTPGFSARTIHGKLGIRSSNTAELAFQDMKVPAENILGKVGDGFRVGMFALDNGRYSTAAACVGVAQSCIDAASSYALERKQFGKTIASFQLVQEMIADMVIETEAARLLVWKVGHLKNRGLPVVKEASMAKYYASEVALKAAKWAIHVHGGYGYSDEYPVERYYRDAMGLSLYEGTAQIQKLIVGRETLGVPAFV